MEVGGERVQRWEIDVGGERREETGARYHEDNEAFLFGGEDRPWWGCRGGGSEGLDIVGFVV